MKRIVCLVAVMLLLRTVAYAQEAHNAEITADYSFFRVNPGLPSYFNSQNLNGGGGDAALCFTSWFGFKVDLQGYGRYTQCTKPGAPTQGCASGNLFTYLFGPQLKHGAGRLEPLPKFWWAARIQISMRMLAPASR
jgi:hypothetical protein